MAGCGVVAGRLSALSSPPLPTARAACPSFRSRSDPRNNFIIRFERLFDSGRENWSEISGFTLYKLELKQEKG
jgi:hypothetical protein